MTALAEASDANYYHVADVETLPEVFEKELGELQSIVARGIIIEIRCPEGVRPLRILGRPGELKSSSETIHFATVSSGQKREIYLECLVTPAALGKVNEIASVAVRYDDAIAKQEVAAAPAPVVVGYSKDSALVTKSVNQAIVAEAAIFSNAVETENAISFADKGDAEASRRIFDVQISKLKEVQAAAPAPQAAALQSEIDSISRAREELESDHLSSEQRKALSNGTWKLRNNKR
jgi:Ca-activated chloride channel family protein